MASVPARPIARAAGLLTTAEAVVPIPAGTREIKLYSSVLGRVGIGSSATLTADVAEVQTITAGDATGGTATYTFQGQTTIATAWNAAAATFQTNLRALTSIGAAGVNCAGGALNAAPVTVAFVAPDLVGDQPLITIDGTNLTGGASAQSRVPTVAITTVAVSRRGYIEAGTQEVYQVREDTLSSNDAFLFLSALSGTGVYRATFVG